MLQTIQLKMVSLLLKILAQKVPKRCKEMERKNCSLTQFEYNFDSAKDISKGGNVNFKIAQKNLVSIQCEFASS